MSNEIIPFGKYKGQPIEAVQHDKQYLDWLMAQSWFKDRYSDLFTVVINNFQEPAETPEHNAMHVKFLDDEYLIGVIEKQYPDYSGWFVKWKRFEHEGWDLACTLSSKSAQERMQISDKLSDLDNAFYQAEKTSNYELADDISQQIKWLEKSIFYANLFIEIKPTVSDDFPAIVRQIKALKSQQKYAWTSSDIKIALFVGQYTGIGATEDQFIQFMANEGITVIFDR